MCQVRLFYLPIYLQVVNGMSLDEKKRLKQEVSKMTPKTAEELLGEKAHVEEIEDEEDGHKVSGPGSDA